MTWKTSVTFEEAVERLHMSAEQFLRKDVGCSCPTAEGVLCYQCAWKKNLPNAASEVVLWSFGGEAG